MSRLGRNYLQVGFYTEVLFPQKNVRFLAINNSIDSNNASDNDFAPFLNIMNEWYAKDTSNKIKAVFDARMKDGKRCSGSIPYGYNRLPNDKQTLVVDPVASEVVKRIFSSCERRKKPTDNRRTVDRGKSPDSCCIRKEISPGAVQWDKVLQSVPVGHLLCKNNFRSAGISGTHCFTKICKHKFQTSQEKRNR